jgi:cbb3-type cytochrome oxidase subunit 3
MDITFIAALVVFALPLVVILILYFLRRRIERNRQQGG